MADCLLEVSGLRGGYGRIPVLDDVSFAVAPGEVVGILGHNGMGKTTLLRTLMGELRATAGTVRLRQEDITRASMARRARRGLGYVPQGRQIFPQLTVRENLRMGEVMHGGQGAIPEMLGYFPALAPLLERPGSALSGGQQQQLALARSLAGRPSLLLLDEPTEGIQPSVVHEIRDILKRLQAAFGLAIVLVEQDLRFIGALASRVMVIQRGRIIATLSPNDLENPTIVEEYLGM